MARFVGSSYWMCTLRKSYMEKPGIVNNYYYYKLRLSVNSIQGGLPIEISPIPRPVCRSLCLD
jgi:hypothetical protein